MFNLSYYTSDPKHIIAGVINHLQPLLKLILSDKNYLKVCYWGAMGYWPDFSNPKTFNEKLQVLKLISKQHPEYTPLVDKYLVKKIVADKIGSQYVIPMLADWESIDDISFDNLPNQFVLKSNSDCGGMIICKDKKSLDTKAAIKLLEKKAKKSYSYLTCEYPYLNVKQHYFAEEYKEDTVTEELRDYKFFCFDGEPKFLFVASDRGKKGVETKFDFFDLNWNHLPIINGHPNAPTPPSKPNNFEEMIQIARKLSEGLPHVRVDLYNCNGNIYFGELTFFHWSGLVPFKPSEWDTRFGELIKLPN